jgi:hypothetical protein
MWYSVDPPKENSGQLAYNFMSCTHRAHKDRDEIKGSVSAFSAGAYTATLYVIVNGGLIFPS